MKTSAYLLSAVLIAGCAATPIPHFANQPFPEGIWTGDLVSQTTMADGTSEADKTEHLLVASCAGKVHVWYGDGTGNYSTHSERFIVSSGLDTHLFYFLSAAPQQPDWIEIQVFTMLEVTQSKARLQWMRAVNNRDLEANDRNRYFTSQGVADLRQASKDCERRFLPELKGRVTP